MDQDCLDYKISEKLSYHKNLKKIISFVGMKYNIVSEHIVLGEKIKKANMKQTKKFICQKCFEYFKIKITFKQINYLLRPHKGKFPYTSIIIIETIYNMLKEENDRYIFDWNKECRNYLDKKMINDLIYEEFMLGSLPERLSNNIDNFMNTIYADIFRCFIDSREIFQEMFGETSVRECLEYFPIMMLSEEQIPETMSTYQEQRIYLKRKKGG